MIPIGGHRIGGNHWRHDQTVGAGWLCRRFELPRTRAGVQVEIGERGVARAPGGEEGEIASGAERDRWLGPTLARRADEEEIIGRSGVVFQHKCLTHGDRGAAHVGRPLAPFVDIRIVEDRIGRGSVAVQEQDRRRVAIRGSCGQSRLVCRSKNPCHSLRRGGRGQADIFRRSRRDGLELIDLRGGIRTRPGGIIGPHLHEAQSLTQAGERQGGRGGINAGRAGHVFAGGVDNGVVASSRDGSPIHREACNRRHCGPTQNRGVAQGNGSKELDIIDSNRGYSGLNKTDFKPVDISAGW